MRTFLVARNHREAEDWRSHQEPPLERKDVIVLSTSDKNSVVRLQRHHRFQAGDRIVWYGNYAEGRYVHEIAIEISQMRRFSSVEPEEYRVHHWGRPV